MSGSCSANTFSWTMATAPSERTRISRRAGHLVLGIDDRIASTVFGTITAMATVTVYGKAFPDSPWKVEELVASTAIVLWIAHLYTHALSESISEDRRLDGARVWSLAKRELGILLAAIPPTIALTLGGLGVFDETVSIWLALTFVVGGMVLPWCAVISLLPMSIMPPFRGMGYDSWNVLGSTCIKLFLRFLV